MCDTPGCCEYLKSQVWHLNFSPGQSPRRPSRLASLSSGRNSLVSGDVSIMYVTQPSTIFVVVTCPLLPGGSEIQKDSVPVVAPEAWTDCNG